MNNPEEQQFMPDRRFVLRAALVLGMSAVLGGCAPRPDDTEKISRPSNTPKPAESPAPSATETAPAAPAIIAAAAPSQLIIPTLNYERTVDGAIHPVPVRRRGDGVYYNPPTSDLVYWAEGCALPASPSEGTTYLLGHSDTARSIGGAAFDLLPELVPQDRIELTTALGRFAYQVTQNLTVPYAELSQHTTDGDFGDGEVKNRLVLITCRVPDEELEYGYNTVIVADQKEALAL